MKMLTSQIDRLIASERLTWSRQDDMVVVVLSRSRRMQWVHLARRGGFYVFSSVVARRAFVTASDDRWRRLAYRVWRRNAMKDLITFAFDERDRLVGLIEQPVATLDENELRLYVELVARECDRFEYLLTGDDAE